MLTLRSLFVVIAVMSCPVFAWADGLIYNLPADGSEVVYDVTTKEKSNNGNGNIRFTSAKGTLSIRSVGIEKINGEVYRWIEIEAKITSGKKTERQIRKLLIAEKGVGRGKNLRKSVKKVWSQTNNGKAVVVRIFQESQTILKMLVPKPLVGVKPLVAKVVTTGIGKLTCQGTSGSDSFTIAGFPGKWTYEIRFSDKAPFGVACFNVKEVFPFPKGVRIGLEGSNTSTIKMTLKSVSKNTKSALPKCRMQTPKPDQKKREKTLR